MPNLRIGHILFIALFKIFSMHRNAAYPNLIKKSNSSKVVKLFLIDSQVVIDYREQLEILQNVHLQKKR